VRTAGTLPKVRPHR